MAQMSAWLEPIRSRIPSDLSSNDAIALQEAITKEALRRYGAFVAGVKAYQASPVPRFTAGASARTVLSLGAARLLDYAPDSAGAAVFVIPSLVNRFDILDIDSDFSFLRSLAEQGLRPFVLDWGEPQEEERGFDLAAYHNKRLIPAFDAVLQATGGRPCAVLGYCMGGVMALALAAHRSADVRALALMATPWDFSGGVGGVPGVQTAVGQMFLRQARAAESYLSKVGSVPAFVLQGLFTSFQPLQILQKFTRFAADDEDGTISRRFVLTEDWLNDGVPLTLPVARETLNDWYDANLPMKGLWSLAGRRVDPAALDMPSYVLIAERDKIVPPEASEALIDQLARPVLHKVPLGHIGLMASDAAPELVWRPLAKWLGEGSLA